MIVEPDFFDHWKTRMLVGLLGNDEFAPMYLMRLWAHCQNRRQSRFDNLPAAAIKGICRFAGDADLLESAMQQSGFVERDENGSLLVVGWDEHNATLVANWTNGKRGGRPARNFSKPNENPNANRVNPTETQTGIGLTQIENGVTEKRREEKIGEEKSVDTCPPVGGHTCEKVTNRNSSHGYTESFERWYAIYPRHEGKQKAATAFVRALRRIASAKSLPTNVALGWLCDATAEFSMSPKGKGEFVPHPATWLNEARYDDDREQWQRGSPATASSAASKYERFAGFGDENETE